MGSIKKEQFY